MSQITHDAEGRQIVSRATLRAVLRDDGERCYCRPADHDGEWDAGPCPEHSVPRRTTRRCFFVIPAPGHYGDRASVLSSHASLAAARRAAGPGYEVRAGAKRKGETWLACYRDIYPVVS